MVKKRVNDFTNMPEVDSWIQVGRRVGIFDEEIATCKLISFLLLP